MQFAQPFDYIPLWALGLIIVAATLLALEAGYLLGRRRSRQPEFEKESTVGTAVAATLGLLGFMLAFTFSIAGSRFDNRRQAVIDEANAIGTTYLRAGLLPDGRGPAVRELLRQYVDARLETVRSGDIETGLRLSADLQRRLWAEAEAVGKARPESIQVGLFVQALNETIDLHTTRVVAALYSRIPLMVWLALYLLTVLSMIAVGYYAGLVSKRRSLSLLILAITFSAVMVLVTDLDRPREGLLRVGQQPLIDLRNSMDEPGS